MLNSSWQQKIKWWCISGIPAIIFTGVVFHYLFELSGNSGLIALAAPVNESVWEHLKLGYWGLVVFSVVEYFFIFEKINNYFLAKACGILMLELTILGVFYGYTLFIDNILLLDIFSFIAGTAVCQMICWKLYTMNPLHVQWLSAATIIGLGILFALFTYYPPQLEIFRDQNTAIFGIPE